MPDGDQLVELVVLDDQQMPAARGGRSPRVRPERWPGWPRGPRPSSCGAGRGAPACSAAPRCRLGGRVRPVVGSPRSAGPARCPEGRVGGDPAGRPRCRPCPACSRSSSARAYGAAVAGSRPERVEGATPLSTTSTSHAPAPSCSRRISRLVWLSSTTSTRRPVSRSVDRGWRDAGVGGAAGSGSVNQKVLPSPGSLSTPSVPPMAVTSWRQMARPRPVPPNLRVVEESACENASNSRSRSALVDADAGVGDLEPDHHAVRVRHPPAGRGRPPRPCVGELHRVGGEVQQHLAQPGRVAAQPEGQLG